MRVAVAEFIKSASQPSEWAAAGPPEIAFAGRSNVGKSSLINVLVARGNLVRTSRTPGRTRLVNFFRVELLDGERRVELRLVDLPGYGYARVSKAERSTWRPTIEAYLGEREPLRAVALLLDARRGVEDDEREIAAWVGGLGRQVVPVLTKSDKLAKHERIPAAQAVTRALGVKPVVFSALDGDGRDELWRRLLKGLPPA